jgi:hypothetical protein
VAYDKGRVWDLVIITMDSQVPQKAEFRCELLYDAASNIPT